MMALMFVLIGPIPAVTAYALPFILLYGISYFFTQFGPNTTTFVYPAEIFPVDVRTTGARDLGRGGKLGAFAGAFLFPDMLASSLGIRRRRDRGRGGGRGRPAADPGPAARAARAAAWRTWPTRPSPRRPRPWSARPSPPGDLT